MFCELNLYLEKCSVNWIYTLGKCSVNWIYTLRNVLWTESIHWEMFCELNLYIGKCSVNWIYTLRNDLWTASLRGEMLCVRNHFAEIFRVKCIPICKKIVLHAKLVQIFICIPNNLADFLKTELCTTWEMQKAKISLHITIGLIFSIQISFNTWNDKLSKLYKPWYPKTSFDVVSCLHLI